jgi:hypothetical protein
MEEMNLIKVHCNHIWKCDNETPCVQLTYANNNVKKVVQVLSEVKQ